MIDIVKLDAALCAFFDKEGQPELRYVAVLWDGEGQLIATNEADQQPLVIALQRALQVVAGGPDLEIFATRSLDS
jgi:hypothetical protein